MQKTYRKNAGIVVFNSAKKVLMFVRSDGNDKTWQFPQGGIDEGESPSQGALRELAEETSITNVKLVVTLDTPISYEFPKEVKDKFSRKGIMTDGQSQYWSLAYFLGSDDEINLKTSTPEFKAWEWTEFDAAPQKVVEFKKEAYSEMVKLLKPYLENYKI